MSDESDRSDNFDARQNRPCASPPAVRRNKHYLACRAGGATKGANASSPGIRSDIAQPGVFCKREPTGSVFAKASP